MASFADLSQDDDQSDMIINLGSESSSQVVDQLVSTTAAPPDEQISLSREIILPPNQLNVISPDLSNPHYRSASFRSSFQSSSSFDDQDCAFLEDTHYTGFLNHADDYSTSEESDISAFLEYARDVVAFNNAPYDPEAFRDFELLLEECLKNHFLDDEDDQDSLMSIPQDKRRLSGYEGDATPQAKRALLDKPMISELASKRIQGIIATKKTIPSTKPSSDPPLTTINGNVVLRSRTDYTKPEVDSDDSLVVPPTISVQTLVDSRVAKERAGKNMPYIISDSSENEVDCPRPKRPRRHRTRKSRKAKRDLPPRKDRISPRSEEKRFNFSTEMSHSPYGSGGTSSISALLSSSPSDKEKVLQFLKKRAPQLYSSVKERLEREIRAETFRLERVQREVGSGFYCTPEKASGCSQVNASSVSSTLTFQKQTKPEFNDQDHDATDVPPLYIDTSSVIFPSGVKAGIIFSAVGTSSEILKKACEDERITVFLTEGIELVLQDILKKQFMLKSQYNMNHSGDGLSSDNENLAERGMAFIHKFRAKRKALLQAKFMEQSQELKRPDMIVPVVQCHEVSEQVEVKKSLQQLESYMMQDQSTSSRSSPSSSIEEQKEKLRKLKEKRRKNQLSQNSRGDSRRNLLQGDSSPVEDVPDKSSVCSDSVSSKGVSSLSKASPFRHIKFPRQKKDIIYEVLSPESSVPPSVTKHNASADANVGSDDDSPLLQGHSPSSSDLTSSSSPGTQQKNSSFHTSGGLKSDDINKIIIDPQSPECLSPIRDFLTSDVSDSSMGWNGDGFGHYFSAHGYCSSFAETNRNIFDMSDISSRIPTIFEDNFSNGHDRLGSSNNNSMWSEMSFQTDPPKFPGQGISTSTGLSINAIAERIEEVALSEQMECSDYNDSFDAIVSRETPARKMPIAFEGTDESPTGVTDSMFPMQKQDNGKSELLSFLEDEDDHLFTDKEDSFAAPTGSPFSTPIFLSANRFEI